MAQTITLNFKIIGQFLERLDDNRIVEKAKNYVNAHFEFNELWDDTTKAILIEGSGLRYKVYLNENNECLIPNRVVRYDGFTLTVVGEDEEKNITITTNDLFISILKNNATTDIPSYVEVIESDTLDVTRDGETYNLEIPDKYLELYVMQENDFSNMEHESGGDWTLDISETLESIIRAFEKRISVDWVTLGLEPPFPNMKKSVYIPTKQITIMSDEEEIVYYIYSATDGYGDTNIAFYYVNATWHCIFSSNDLVDRETFNFGLGTKQDVLEAGEGITIEGNTISATGGKLYQHSIKMIGTGATAGDRLVILNMLSYSNQPKTWDNVKTYCTNLQQATGWISASGENRSIHSVKTAENANRLFVYYGSDGVYAFMPEPTSLTDTITEVE